VPLRFRIPRKKCFNTSFYSIVLVNTHCESQVKGIGKEQKTDYQKHDSFQCRYRHGEVEEMLTAKTRHLVNEKNEWEKANAKLSTEMGTKCRPFKNRVKTSLPYLS